jgi:hypothetical protein
MFLKKKSEIFNSKKYVVMVERQSDRKVKAIKSDNGGEYFSKEFGVFYEMHGNTKLHDIPHRKMEWKRG